MDLRNTTGIGKKEILQQKSGPMQRSNGSVAPPVYRPAPPQTAQAKGARPAGAPPVYRPQPIQKTPAVAKAKPGTAPPVYRPQNRPNKLQRRTSTPAPIQRSLSNLPLSIIAGYLGGGDQARLQEALGFQIPEPDDLEVVEDYVPGPLREMDRARAVTVLKRADWIPPAIGSTNVILPGKMFYRFDDGPLSPLTAGMIDDFWDAKYGAPFVRMRGPEWRSNCGDYATGTEGHSLGDVPQVWGFLNGKPIGDKHDVKGKNLETISLLLTSLADGTYVFAYASHFVRMAVAGPNVRVSQKDADSGVYSTNMNRQQAAAYVAARSDVLSSAGVFKI